ncbi:MAG: hypothetical protein K6G50_02165 [bacterium]|nr:hypothetical protein [bacterium]
MNSISGNNSMNMMLSAQALGEAPANSGAPATENAALPADTAEISPEANGDGDSVKLSSKFKSAVKKGADTFKEIDRSPITFVKHHKKLTAGAVGGAVVAGGAAVALLSASTVKNVCEIGYCLADGSISNRIKAFSSIASMVGVAGAVGAIVGGAGIAIAGAVKAGKGVKNIVANAKKHDGLKTAKAARSTVTGSRQVLNGVIVSTLELGGEATAAGKFTKNKIYKPLRGAVSALNVGIGAKVLHDGIKTKDRAKIINGCLDLAYGTSVAVSMCVGGPVASVVCTALLAAKTGVRWIRAYKEDMAKEKEAKAKNEAAQNAAQNDPKADKAAKAPEKVSEVKETAASEKGKAQKS